LKFGDKIRIIPGGESSKIVLLKNTLNADVEYAKAGEYI